MHYPGTDLAGIYNRLTSTVHGRQVEDEHLVNAPNWLAFDLRTPDGTGWFTGAPTDRQERRELDLRRGVLTRYRAAYGNIGRLDLILEAEGDSTNWYKLAKQADTLTLIYPLGPDELLRTLDRLGYPAAPALLARTVDYYLARTAHGSTLSRVVHASVLARMDPHRAWHTFREALAADLDDAQGGTTGEGIHLGAMAGTIDIITRAFAGSRIEDTTVSLDPRLPPELRRVTFNLVHRGQRLRVTNEAGSVRVAADACVSNPDAQIRIGDAGATVHGGRSCTLPIARCGHPAPEPGDTSTPAR